MKKYSTYLLSATFLASMALPPFLSAQTTQKLSATKANDYGLIYSLPTTVLDITIVTEHVVREPGQFYKYAKKYLNVDNPITERSESWTVKSVIVNARGVANTSERYLMQFKAGQTPFLVMSDSDLPLAINSDNVVLPEQPVMPLPTEAAPTPLETEAARHVITEEMLRSQSVSKRAELAAQRIYDLRSSRNDFITGQADQMPPDGQALQIIIDELTGQEAALTAMFLGTTQVSTDVSTITYTPGDSDVRRHILARVSSVDGIVDSENLAGDPIILSIKVTSRGHLPVNEATGQPRVFPKGGVAYCIPGSANMTISFGDKTLWDGSFDAAQYGIVFGLDPKMFSDKKAPAYLLFDPVTGAIKELGTKD